MAERTAVFNLKINDDNSAAKVAKNEKEMAKFRKSTEGAQKSASGFEKELKRVNKVVESGNFSVRESNRLIQDYQTIAIQAGKDSPIGQEAIRQAAELTDRMGKLRNEVNNLSNDGKNLQGAMQLSQGVLGGYQAFAGVTAMLGVENEELMQTMVKLQAVQQAAMGIEQARKSLEEGQAARRLINIAQTKLLTIGTAAYAAAQKGLTLAIGTSTGSLKLFRLALVATGVGAIVVGLGLLIANFETVKKAVQNAVTRFKNMGEGVKTVLSIIFPFIGVIRLVVAGLKAMGIIESQEAKDAKARADARAEQIRQEREDERTRIKERIEGLERERKSLDDKYSFEIRKARAAGEDVTEMERQKMEATITSTKEQIKATDELIKSLMDEIKVRMMSGSFAIEERNELNELMKTRKELANTVKTTSQDLEVFDIQQKKQSSDRSRKSAEEEIKNEQQKQDELLKLKQTFTDLTLANIEDEEIRLFAQLQQRQIREKEQLIAKYGEDTELLKQLETNQQAEMDALDEKLKQKRSEEEAVEAEKQRQEEILRLENDLMFMELEAQEKLAKELELEQIRRDALLANDELTAEERRKIEEQYKENIKAINQEVEDDQKKTAEAIKSAKLDMFDAISGAIGQLAGVAKEGSALQKAAALGEIAAQTAMGFVRGLGIAQQAAAASGPAAPFVFPAFYASQIGAVLSAANKARGILGKGGGASAPSASAASPTSQRGGDGATDPNTRDIREGEPNVETKVTVTETDISRVQKRVTDIDVRSTF